MKGYLDEDEKDFEPPWDLWDFASSFVRVFIPMGIGYLLGRWHG